MKKFIRKWLDIDLDRHQIILRLDAINEHLNSREPCKVCGHHRYTKKTSQRHDEIERARSRRRKRA